MYASRAGLESGPKMRPPANPSAKGSGVGKTPTSILNLIGNLNFTSKKKKKVKQGYHEKEGAFAYFSLSHTAFHYILP